jgi:hypothetical protein
LEGKNKMKNKEIDKKKGQMHGPNPGGLAYLAFKKLSRVGLSAHARVPEMSFFLFSRGE